jgi:chromosome segregation ATPase
MTIVGKAFVFLLVLMSLTTLGLAIGLAIDRHNWMEEHNAIGQEIYKRQEALDKERGALITLLDEINKGDRQMPWDPETGATPAKVIETKKQIVDLGEEIKTLFNQQNQLHVDVRGLVDELAQAHEAFKSALAEHRNLRQQIKPENPNQKGFRDQIDEHRAAKEAAETAQENLKPDIFNELVRVQQVKNRLDELEARVKELKTGGRAAAKAK